LDPVNSHTGDSDKDNIRNDETKRTNTTTNCSFTCRYDAEYHPNIYS